MPVQMTGGKLRGAVISAPSVGVPQKPLLGGGGGSHVDPNVYPGAPSGAPANPVDAGLLGEGLGPLAGQLGVVPPLSFLPPDLVFCPVRDISGNVWWLLIGQKLGQEIVTLPDYAAMLRFFVFGIYSMSYTRNQTANETRENVDIPNITQYSNFSPIDTRATDEFFPAIVAFVRKNLNLQQPQQVLTGAGNRYVNSAAVKDYNGAVVNNDAYYFGSSNCEKGVYDVHESVASSFISFVASPDAPIYSYRGDEFFLSGDYGPSATNLLGREIDMGSPDYAKRVAFVDNIPLQLPVLPAAGFGGEFYALGDSWSRVAVLKGYNRRVYPAKYFGCGTVNTSMNLDEARTVETVHQSIKAVGDLVNGIMTFNFSPLTDSLTNAVNGPALANVRNYELQLQKFRDSAVKMGFGYGKAMLQLTGAQNTGKTGGKPKDGIIASSAPMDMTLPLAAAAIFALAVLSHKG